MKAQYELRFPTLVLTALAGVFLFSRFSLSDAGGVRINFDLNAVTQLKWTADDQSVTLKKQKSTQDPNGLWVKSRGTHLLKDFRADSWAIHRRLVLLAQIAAPVDSAAVALSNGPMGDLEISAGKEKIEGSFDTQNFVWKTGPNAGHGFPLASQPEFKDLINEGIMGLSKHEIALCDPKKVSEIDNIAAGWAIKREKDKWTLVLASGDIPARPFEAAEWSGRVCKFKVDRFVSGAPSVADADRGGREPILRVLWGKNEVRVSKEAIASGGGGYRLVGGERFVSSALDATLQVHVDYLKDVSIDAGKIALDTHMPQKDRIDAIRKMRDAHSPESVVPLKKLIDEETEIDLYRYEAVDALAAIGTKAAYKAIADRLAEIGRSGFELRLARALAMGMGTSFRSDEKTPEPQRRKEVQDLLERARKDPPGR